MSSTKSYGTFAKTPRKGLVSVDPEDRSGREQVKYPLPIINPNNPSESVAEQAGACAACKDATCSSRGCPMGKDIGSANVALAGAGGAATSAFSALKDHSPEEAAAFAKEISEAGMQVSDYGVLEEGLFRRLEKVDPDAAKRYQSGFENFMYEAYQTFDEGGGRGDIYGLACPSESVTCGSTCQIQFAMARGITIAMNEQAIYEYAWNKGWVEPITPHKEKEQSIAVIGSGATGTHLGLDARKKGFQVTTFEKNPQPGELGDGKILSYKVPLHIWERDIQWQKDSGIKLECDSPIGKNGEPITGLANNFNAVVIAIGTPVAKDHGLKGDAKEEVVFSNGYLQTEQNDVYKQQLLKQGNSNLPPEHNANGKRVLINGHGDTAVDCARTAIAQGALSVTLISRRDHISARDSGDKGAFNELVKEAGDKLKFQHYMSAEKIVSAENGYTLYGKNTDPKPESATIELSADMVISAIGNNAGKLKEVFELQNLPVTKAGTVEIQLPAVSTKTFANGVLGGFVGRFKNGTPLFAGGEAVTGSSLLVTSGKAGIDLARMIDDYMKDPDAFYEEVENESGRPVVEIS